MTAIAADNTFDASFWLDIRKELLRTDTEVFSEIDTSIPDEVTHYTSLVGLEGIIGKREIWCTDIRQVNDNRECDHGMQVIQSVIGRKSVPQPFTYFVHGLTSLFGSKEAWTYYISCFCSSQHASRMWEDYSHGGTGFGIVFDSKILFAGCDGGRAYSFAPVIYDAGVQVAKTTEVIDRAIQLQRRRNLPKRLLMDYWRKEVAFYLLTCGFRFKAPCWRHEQEVRIAIAEHDGLKRFDYAGKTRVAVPFEQAAVIRVVRGPNARADTLEQIREMLNRAGYGADIPIW